MTQIENSSSWSEFQSTWICAASNSCCCCFEIVFEFIHWYCHCSNISVAKLLRSLTQPLTVERRLAAHRQYRIIYWWKQDIFIMNQDSYKWWSNVNQSCLSLSIRPRCRDWLSVVRLHLARQVYSRLAIVGHALSSWLPRRTPVLTLVLTKHCSISPLAS